MKNKSDGTEFVKGQVTLCEDVVLADYISVRTLIEFKKRTGKNFAEADWTDFANVVELCCLLAAQFNKDVDEKAVREKLLDAPVQELTSKVVRRLFSVTENPTMKPNR